MKYLTIIRHAKSSWDDPALDDLDRPLNPRGKRAIGTIGAYLQQKGLDPDLLLSSPARRARQTAEGIARALDIPKTQLRIEPLIYFGTVPELVTLLSGLDNTLHDVFLFGHEPLLSGLIHRLGGPVPEKFPTCAVFRFALALPDWTAIATTTGHCEFYVYPKMLGGE